MDTVHIYAYSAGEIISFFKILENVKVLNTVVKQVYSERR